MNEITIFTDGASRGNPGKAGWGAIVSFSGRVEELGGREDLATNNQMEMRALLESLRLVSANYNDETIKVYIDSSYVVNGMTKWVNNWKKNNWKTKQKAEVLNRDLWEELSRLSENKKIEYILLEGHVGIPGNERVDEIASTFADNNPTELYEGSLSDYRINLKSTESESYKKANKDRSKLKAFSYLSLVDGKAMRHKTWAECEARVKGKANAKFRKAVSAEEEEQILSDWGVSLK